MKKSTFIFVGLVLVALIVIAVLLPTSVRGQKNVALGLCNLSTCLNKVTQVAVIQTFTVTPKPMTKTPTSTLTLIPPTKTFTITPSFTPIIISPTLTGTPLPTGVVYYISPAGNDTNPGTLAQPWRTIYKAVNSLQSGQIGIVNAGTYNESINIVRSGITLEASGKVITKNVLISGDSNVFRGFTITDPISDWGIRVNGNNNLAENNEIYNTKQDGIWFFGSYNTFRNNYIHDILTPGLPITHVDCFQTWGWDWNVTNILFENNICINNSDSQYSNQIVQAAPDDPLLTYSDITLRGNLFVIYQPTWAGVDFWWSTGYGQFSNIIAENNTIVNMTRERRAEGINFINVNGATAINNLFIGFGDVQTGYITSTGTASNIHHNAIWNPDGIAPNKSYPNDLWMINPMVDTNYKPLPDSPLCTAGTNGTYIGAYPCK